MKRPISCALALIIIFSCTQGGFVSRAEEVEVASTQVEEAAELASEIDAEGLTIELDEIEAEDAIPEAGEEEAEAEAVATRAALYARVEKLTEIFDAPEGGVIATLEQGGVALVLDAAEWTRIAFDTPRGTVTGYVAADRLTLLDDAETGAFLDQLIASEAVTLYDGDLDRPLATLECAFPEAESGDAEAPAEEPSGESIPEPSEEPTAEPSEEPSAEPTAEPSEEPSAEPTVEIAEAETPEPTAEPAETVEPTGTPEPVVTPAPTEEVVIASADELGTLDKMFAAAGFAIEQSASTVAVGGSCTISAVNANGAAIGSSELTYGSSNESVAKVSDSGVVSGIAPGSVNITVTYNSNTLYSAVQVLAAPSAVKLPTKLLLGVKEQGARLTPVLVPIAGQTACAPVTYTWSSSNRKVVAIDAKTGVMKAKRKGTATITVTTSNGKKAKCKVYVRKAPGKVTLSPKSVKLSAGGMKFKLTAKLPKSTGGTVSYTSSNTRVATVAADGTITTVGKGSAVITARTFNGKTSKCTVNVTDVPSTASFAATTRVLPATVSFSPSVSVKAADGSDAAANLSFVVTSGANCVNIGSNGSITGVKTGTAVITGITHNGVRTGNSCTITVVAAPSSVSLNKAKMSMGKGQTYRLTPMLGNVSGAGLTLTWKSSKSKVATVDATGLVTALKTGSTTITVKTANGKKAKIKVKVTE